MQIGCGTVPFREYQVDGNANDTNYNCNSREDNVLVDLTPTGTELKCRVGKTGSILFLPHQIDAGGSVLVELDEDQGGLSSSSLTTGRNLQLEDGIVDEAKQKRGRINPCNVESLEPPASYPCIHGMNPLMSCSVVGFYGVEAQSVG